MELKKYQRSVIADLSRYLELLGETANSDKAYSLFWQEKGIHVGFAGMKGYQNTLPGVPSVCMKVPTGGGKTFLACNAVKTIFDVLPALKTKVVVWLVPSDAILTQTIAALRNPDHPYRQKLDVDFGSRVEIYSKEQLQNGQNFNPTVVMEQLCICVLSYDSFRGRKENLKARQENSNLDAFIKVFGLPEHPIEDADENALLQVLNILNPLVIIDESHHAKSALSLKMLKDFNPCFVLELTATPKDGSNIISYVDAVQLKRESMVKLPVVVYNRDSQAQVLADTIDLRNKLEELATAERAVSGRYVRPIALFQAQPKGKENSTTFEKLRDKLVEIGIPAKHIAIRTADVNELKNVDLMAEDCPVRYIITVNALKEGWDCPFAYILSSLANKTSKIDVEQILGRILRLPHTKQNKLPALNMSYVLTSSNDFADTLQGIVRGLNAAGFSDKDCRIGTEPPTAPAAPVFQPVQQSIEEKPQDEPAEEFLAFEPQQVTQDLQQRQTDAAQSGSASVAEAMLAAAEQTGQAYEETMQQQDESPETQNLAWEVKEKLQTFFIKPEYQEEVADLRLPQFVHIVPETIFSEGHFELLERETLSEGFTLKGKSSDIAFDSADTQMVYVDVRDQAGVVPQVYKMSSTEQQAIKEYLSKATPKQRIDRCKHILHQQLNKLNTVDASELKQYIDRIVEDMTEEQLAGLEKSPLAYAKKIREKIESLLEEHYEQQFNHWLETGQIECQEMYSMPSMIHPTESTSMIGGSLYSAEEEMNGLERDLVLELTAISSVRWWHRNIAKHGFRINGFINHYPDIMIMTQKGNIIFAETKGAHLKNDDSAQKVRLGRAWQNAAGKKYRYYMVFKDTDSKTDGMISMSDFLEIIKVLIG